MRRHPGEHRHRKHDRDLRQPPRATTAICGLVAYQDRAGARWAAKTLRPLDGQAARAYRCRDGCELFHAGYLPELVAKGVVTAGEWYGYNGHEPLRDVITPMLAEIHRRTHGRGSFERRVDNTGTDLWTAMIERRGKVYTARDFRNPIDATAAVLLQWYAARNRTDPVAA